MEAVRGSAMGQDEFDLLLQLVYACPGDLAGWQRVLDALGRVFLTDDVHLAALDRTGAIETDFITSRAAGEAYRDHYGALDLAVHRLVRGAPGRAMSERGLLSREELARCPVQHELLPQHGIATRLWVKSGLERDGTFVATLLRAKGRGAFEAAEERCIERLQPHLRQAMALHRTVEMARRERGTVEAGLDALPIGFILLDAGGRLLFGNKAAQRMFRARGLRVLDGRLSVSGAGMDARLHRAIAGAAGGKGGDSFVIPGQADGRMRVRVLPLAGGILEAGRAAVAVLVEGDGQGAVADADTLRAASLTPAEVALVVALVGGQTVGEHAAGVGRSVHTVRAQLRSALGKTGTHRQSELVLFALGAGGSSLDLDPGRG